MADVTDLTEIPTSIDLTSSDVVDLDAPEVVDAGPRPRRAWRTWAVAALVVALVAVAASGVWLYRERTAYQSDPAWVAASAYLDAVNAGDTDRLQMATTSDVVWTGYDPKGAVAATYTGADYILFQSQFFPGFRLEVLGPPTVYGDAVTVPVHVSGRLGVDYDAMTTFMTRTDAGTVRVEAIMAIPVQ